MRGSLIVLAALAMLPGAAEAQKLKVVEVSAPAINCVFNASCTITVSDTTGNILFPTVAPGTGFVWVVDSTEFVPSLISDTLSSFELATNRADPF